MAGEIANDGWLWENFQSTAKNLDNWHNLGGSAVLNKSQILYYYNVQISGSYADNQLVEKQHISSVILNATLTTSGMIDGQWNPVEYFFNFNINSNNGFTSAGSSTIRANIGKTVTISLNNLILKQITGIQEYVEDSYGNPNESGGYREIQAEKNYLKVLKNNAVVGSVSNGQSISVQLNVNDTLRFGWDYDGLSGSYPNIDYFNGPTTLTQNGTITIS